MTCISILCLCLLFSRLFLFFKQKTAYEMRISDWSSDVCSSDLVDRVAPALAEDRHQLAVAGVDVHRLLQRDVAQGVDFRQPGGNREEQDADGQQIGRASCRERECRYV